jgi:hypothetical protein
VIGGAIVAVLAVAVLVGAFFSMLRLEQSELVRLNAENARVQGVHRRAGNKWYPHVYIDGSVRWMPVSR